MKIVKKMKKGFTLVELIVVIAIVAILAAVSVVSYVAFINSANESADLQLVKQINLCMEASEVLHGKNGNMQQALDTAFDNGFVIENLTPRSNKDIVWNSESNRFELLDKAPANHPEIMFKIYNSVAEMLAGQTSEGYSAYLHSDENVNDVLEEKTGSNVLTLHTGFDAGSNQTIQKAKYINEGAKQTVIWRTNSGDLVVDGDLDTVKHYGVGRYLSIDAVGPTDCYHEYGVFGEIQIHEGKLIIQNSGFVGTLRSDGTHETVAIENNGTIMDAANVPADIEITGSGNLDSTTIEVTSFDQFQGLAFACNQGTTFEGYTLKLMTDIDMTDKVWVPFGKYCEKNIQAANNYWYPYLNECHFFMGNIEGNGHKIINLSNKGFKYDYVSSHHSVSGADGANYGLIAIGTKNIKISNLDISFKITREDVQPLNCVGIIGQYYGIEVEPIVKHYKDANEIWTRKVNSSFDEVNNKYELKTTTVEFNNVNVSGSIDVTGSAAAFVGTTYVTNQVYNFDDNCIYAYGNSKVSINKQARTTEQMRSLATDGYYYENFLFSGDNCVTFTLNGVDQTVYSTASSTFAPLHVNYKFINCESSDLNIYANDRAAVYIGKLGHSVCVSNMYDLDFTGSVNSGNVYSYKEMAGIVSGFYTDKKTNGIKPIVNSNHASVLTNSGTATIYYGSDEPQSGLWLTNHDVD